MSPVFIMDHPDFRYDEFGLLKALWIDRVEIELPVFERLDDKEEAKLGANGIRKSPVGSVVLVGRCSLNCAKVQLVCMQVKKKDGTIVWEWTPDTQ